MTRPFDAPNAGTPAAVQALAVQTPACFRSRDAWVLYLREVWRSVLDDAPARKRMERGQVPDYCADCVVSHQVAMQIAGRCKPPEGAETPRVRARAGVQA